MSSEKSRRERRDFEGWEDYLECGVPYAACRPVPRLWKPINPSDATVEKFVGEGSRRRNIAEEILPAINSKKSALFIFSVISALGVLLTAVGVLSLLSILTTGGPFPGLLWHMLYGDVLYSDLLVAGSMELVVFGLLLSIPFGVLAVRNFSKMKMLERMLARSNKGAIRST